MRRRLTAVWVRELLIGRKPDYAVSPRQLLRNKNRVKGVAESDESAGRPWEPLRKDEDKPAVCDAL